MDVITCDDVLGKEVLDPEGEVIGIAIKLHIDRKKKKLVGITVDTGFMKPDLFIGINNIKSFGKEAIFLFSVPYDKIIGKRVINLRGNYLGKVSEIEVEDKRIKRMEVKKFRNKETIEGKEIIEVGEVVVVK